MPFDFSLLRREPDFTAPELFAYDATDRLLLDDARDAVVAASPGEVVTIGDRHGALTLGVLELRARGVRVHQDALLGERALRQNAERLKIDAAQFTHHDLGSSLLTGARVVLLQLPTSLDALAEVSDHIARYAHPEVTVFAGGRVKHMTRRQNDVLGAHVAKMQAGLARQKSRVLTATGVRRPEGSPPFPVWGDDPDVGVRIAAFGATFGGATLDHGSRLLLRELQGAVPQARHIVDLGCGNGVIAAELARLRPDATVIATDQSHAAVRATALTVEAAGVAGRVRVTRADGVEAVADGLADLIVLNPPFHSGHTVHEGVAHRLIASTSRALRPGGELWVVFNSHLRYRPLIEQTVGPARQVARDRTYTVIAARRRP